MKKNRIFLSYRRDDSAGYVSRLENELERVFGDGRVFRDATDIPGGAKWKNVIDANLHSSAVLILVIGPRWEHIWHERINDDVNYVALELQRARELEVPIIPVTLDGTELSKGLDLGSINFIYDNQFHDISDRQGRWLNDFEQLVKLIESVPGMGSALAGSPVPPQPDPAGSTSGFKWLAVVASILIVAAVWFGIRDGLDEPGGNTDQLQPVDQPIVLPDKALTTTAETTQVLWRTMEPAPGGPLPNISGKWQWRDGSTFIMTKFENGTFGVESSAFGSGQARFIANMPGKFEIEMFGIGRGEFAVSTSGGKAMGWFVFNNNSQQNFGSLIQID